MSDEMPPAPHGDGGHGTHDEKAAREPLNKLKMAAWFFLGTLATSLLMGVLYLVVATWENSHEANDTTQAIRDTQKTNTANAQKTTKLLHLVKSCVTPDGKCAKRSAKSQAGFAGALNQYNVLSASCAAKLIITGVPPGVSQDQLTRMITRCVVVQLAHAKKAIQDQRN